MKAKKSSLINKPSRKKPLRKKRSLIKGGNITDITYQCDLTFNGDHVTAIYTTESDLPSNTIEQINSLSLPLRDVIMTHILPNSNDNTKVIHNFLNQIYIKVADILNPKPQDMFNDITTIVKNYGTVRPEIIDDNNKSNNKNVNFQSNYFEVVGKKQGISKNITIYKDIFGKYEIYNKENERKFVTIDPSIIQIMIFDDTNPNDIVYSLKLIYRTTNTITLRYTTKLFPKNSKIEKFTDLDNFNKFNTTLGNSTIDINYHNLQLLTFLKKYIKFYNFYRKCYTFEQECPGASSRINKKLIEYQLKYISILGKARFGDPIIQVRTATITDYIMSNLLFASPSYAFISGGYKGFKDNKYGVTRSGYEISKRYNRPILTIMCAEGKHDAHEFSDATLIYGEHWGEDSIALSQLTDGAIIIAPFGGWTYIECLTLLANKKIVGIYNDFFNILNYNGEATNDNANFFKFTITEQKNIINYNINYYLILLYLLHIDGPGEHEEPGELEKINSIKTIITTTTNLKECLEFGVKLLLYLKVLLENVGPKYQPVKDAEDAYNIIKNRKTSSGSEFTQKRTDKAAAEENIKKAQENFSEDVYVKHLVDIITNFKVLKSTIDDHIKRNFDNINIIYRKLIKNDNYQNNIPEKCDGIWIKPIFDLINICITGLPVSTIKIITPIQSMQGGCSINNADVKDILDKIKINITYLNNCDLFKSLNTNIIFVFSDVMYLNIYLNEYLNTPSFQQNIQNKISNLLTLQFNGDTLKNIIDKEKKYELILERNIDGTLDEKTKTITNELKIRQNYTFKINSDCNNYTNLIDIKFSAELPEGPSANIVLNGHDKTEYKTKYDSLIKEERDLLNKLLLDADNHTDFKKRMFVRSQTERQMKTLSTRPLLVRSHTHINIINHDDVIEEAPAPAAPAAQVKGGGVRRKNKY